MYMNALKLFTKYFLNQQPAAGPVKQTDFADMYVEPVDFEVYKKEVRSLCENTQILKTITYNGKPYEVLQLDINPQARKRLLIFAGVHGNEFAAALAVIDLLKDIKQYPGNYRNCHLRIIAPLNPVGLVYQSRYNEIGRDINRDFKDFVTVGGKLQKQAIEEFNPDFLITLHEGPQDGFFVVAENDTPKSLQSKLVQALEKEDVQLAKKSFLRFGISKGYWHKARFFYAIQKLLGIYTLGRFSHERKLPQLTTESPWASKDVAVRRKGHVVTVRTVAESLSQ